MPSSTLKHSPLHFSPLQVIYNYLSNIKNSIRQFFKQYLRPDGRQILIVFNRYLIIILLINIDIRLLFAISLIGFMFVKMIKIKPWKKQHQSNHPLSFLNAIYEINKKQTPHQLLLKPQNQITLKPIQKFRLEIKNVEQKQKLLKNQEKQKAVGKFNPQQIEHQIYKFFNKMISGYCKLIWYINFKSISIIWLLVLLIYILEPSHQYDTLKLKTKENGVLEIAEVKRASENINYFHLIFFGIMANIIIFYHYGTKELVNQVLLEVYTKQYTIDLIKKKKLYFIKSYTKTKNGLGFRSNSINDQSESNSPQFFSKTFIDKKKHHNPVDLQVLKDFALNLEPKQPPEILIAEPLPEAQFSHILPMVPLENPLKKSYPNNSIIELMFQRQFYQSEEEPDSEQDHSALKITNSKEKASKIKKPLNNKDQADKELQQEIGFIGSLITHPDKKKKLFQEKNNFFLKRQQEKQFKNPQLIKSYQQIKDNHKNNQFKLSPLKVQEN